LLCELTVECAELTETLAARLGATHTFLAHDNLAVLRVTLKYLGEGVLSCRRVAINSAVGLFFFDRLGLFLSHSLVLYYI